MQYQKKERKARYLGLITTLIEKGEAVLEFPEILVNFAIFLYFAEPSFSCPMWFKSFTKDLFKEHMSFCSPNKLKFLSQSGCSKVKDKQGKHWNIHEYSRFLLTIVNLYAFLNEQEIHSKHNATLIVNYSNIKKY